MGALQEVQTSKQASGVSPLPLVAYWKPATAGKHTLTVRAFNARGARAHAAMTLTASDLPDRDADNVPDRSDLCPEQAGTPGARGCPDRDGDGIADAGDACPEQTGLAGSRGCPAPIAGMRMATARPMRWTRAPGSRGAPPAARMRMVMAFAIRRTPALHKPAGPRTNGCPTPGDSDGDEIADASDPCPGLPEA